MIRKFKTILISLLEKKSSFKSENNFKQLIDDVYDYNLNDSISDKNNVLSFKLLIVKYLVIIYSVYNKLSVKDIFNLCRNIHDNEISSEIIISIQKTTQLITDIINNDKNIISQISESQINDIKDLKLPKNITINNIYDILMIIEFPLDKYILNKIIDNNVYLTTQTTKIEIVKNNNTDINILDLNNINNESPDDKNLSYDIYNFLQSTKENEQQKILFLLNSKILIPITSELFIKHDNHIKYKSHELTTDKNKIDFIVSEINKYINAKEKSPSQTIKINEYENINLISNNPSNITSTLSQYTNNSYINYYTPEGIFITLNKYITSIRKQLLLDKSKNIFKPNGAGSIIDLVGFCIIVNDINNYASASYDKFIKSIKKYISGKLTQNIYWLYTKQDDNNNDMLKSLLDKIYDVIIYKKTKVTYKQIIQSPNITFDVINDIIIKNFNMFPEIINNDDLFNNIQFNQEQKNNIVSKLKLNNEIDDFKNKLFGLDDDIIKLPVIKFNQSSKVFNINTINDNKPTQQNTICMHIVELNELTELSKNDPLTYDKLMQEFANKYIGELNNGTRVCKSCGAKIFLDKLGISGTFDDNKHFNIHGINLMSTTKLLDLPEYKTYKNTILKLDMLIDKVGKIMNLLYISGSNYDQRKTRTSYIKNIIDLIIYNSAYFDKQNMNERYKLGEEEYGINKAFTDFFIFDLDDTILQTVTYTKDYQKNKKINNIFIYVIITIILSIDKNNIYDMVKTSQCNYTTYKKTIKIFDNIKIKTAKSTEDIKNYPVLCYIIFMFACMLSKYNLYYTDITPSKNDHKHQLYITIIRIINTTIDILNSIVETYIKIKSLNEKIEIMQLFNKIYTQYSFKLKSFYNDTSILKSFENENITYKIDMDIRIKNAKLLQQFNPSIPINYPNNNYSILITQNEFIKTPQMDLQPYTPELICSNGFHKYVVSDGTIICSKCGKTYKELLNITNKKYEELNNNNQLVYINNIAQFYCFTGDHLGKKHSYELLNNKYKCSKCGYTKGTKISTENLIKLGKKYYEKHLIDNKYESEDNDIQIPKLKNDIIDNFLKLVPEKEIIENNEDIKIYKNIYTFDHNHLGYRLTPPLVLTEDNITFSHDKYFNMDVYYYVKNNIHVYYNKYTNILLGYRQTNNDYVKNKQLNIFKADVKYSIKHEIESLFDGSNIKDKDIEYINVCNFINEYIVGINGFLYNVDYDYPFNFKYFISKLNAIKDNKIDVKLIRGLFNNWKNILQHIYNKENLNDYFVLYILFELTEFITNIKSQEQQKIISNMTMLYIDYYFKRTKLNLNLSLSGLIMSDIIDNYSNDTMYLISYNEMYMKYIDNETTTEEITNENINNIENKTVDEENMGEDFDIDSDLIDENDDDDGKVID